MAKQIRLGEFWLAWRTDRGEWAICWNDGAAGTRRRKSTGCRDFGDGDPPIAAQEALAQHFKQHGQPEAIDPNAKASASRLMTEWLAKEASQRARAAQYAYAQQHWQRWFEREGNPTVSALNPTSTRRYIQMRKSEGVKGETIHGEVAALNRALRWATENDLIPYAPKLAKVEAGDRSGPREIEYSPEQVAAILEAALTRMDRQHVHLFAMIMLSCHARVEAVMELDASQIRNDLIYFNAPDRKQTRKKRSIVPVCESLVPWLPKEGKVIVCRQQRKDGSIFARPTYSIRTSWENVLIDAGVVDGEGNAWGYPNALRHTCHTYLQAMGVPQAQIDAMAGHSGEQGSGRNYTHLRPEYLKEAIQAVEEYWSAMDKLTRAHRSQFGPKVFDIKSGKALK